MHRGSKWVVFLAAVSQTVAVETISAAPTREVANACRVLAYKAYPAQRPGSVIGSGARYEFFKDCISKDGKVDVPQSPPVAAGRP